jgi:signal transduction histidine kinase
MLVLNDGLMVDHANDAALRLLSHTGVEVGSSFLEIFDAAAQAAVRRALDTTAIDVVATAEAHIVGPVANRLVPLEITASPFTTDGRRRIGVVVRDRTEAVTASRRLRDREEQYRTVFMRAPLALREEDFSEVGMWLDDLRARGITDLDRYLDDNPEELRTAIKSIRTIRVNPACVELMKADNASQLMVGFRDSELTPEVIDSFRAQVHALWNRDYTFETELEGRNYLFEPFACRIHWTVRVIGDTPDLSRVVVAILDISAIRAAQDRLEALIEEKDRFIASISHELRTPLASVYGLAQELHELWDNFDEPEIRSLIAIIAAQSADLAALVEDLLLVAKLDMGEVVVVPELCDVLALAGRSIDDLRRSDEPIGEITLRGEPSFAWADPGRVRQILRNLLVNAARYGGPQVDVVVEAGETVFVHVADDGPGLPEDQWESIFAPYHRASEATPLGSLGLGLAISRNLARAMHGDVTYSVQDSASVFTLSIPGAQRAAGATDG